MWSVVVVVVAWWVGGASEGLGGGACEAFEGLGVGPGGGLIVLGGGEASCGVDGVGERAESPCRLERRRDCWWRSEALAFALDGDPAFAAGFGAESDDGAALDERAAAGGSSGGVRVFVERVRAGGWDEARVVGVGG